MAQWNVFNRSKTRQDQKKKEIEMYMQETEKALKQNEELYDDGDQDKKELPKIQYDETLYSTNESKKNQPVDKIQPKIHRDTWENTSTIEKHVDTIDDSDTQKLIGENGIEEKVDQLLAKKKKL